MILLVALVSALFWILIMIDQAITSGPGFSTVVGIKVVGLWQHLAITPLVTLLIAGLMAVGYGLVRERVWARRIAASYWLAAGILIAVAKVLVPSSGLRPAGTLLAGLALSALAWLYFYRQPKVALYYAEIRSRRKR